MAGNYILKVFSERGGASREVYLTQGKIKLLSIILGILILSGGITGLLSLKYGLRWIDYIRISQENEKLKNELLKIRENLDILESKLDSIYTEDIALRTIAGIDYPPSEFREMGVGGFQEFSETPLDSILSDVKLDIERFLNLSDFELSSYRVIKEKLEKNRLIRDHTPSIMPVSGYVSSRFGYRRDPFTGRMSFHPAVDISAPKETPIVAPAVGVVKSVRWEKGYGLTLKIDHGNGVITKYAHNARVAVRVGERVKRGEVIAYVGNTGKSTGPHLHYEVRVNGKRVNPFEYIIPPDRYYD